LRQPRESIMELKDTIHTIKAIPATALDTIGRVPVTGRDLQALVTAYEAARADLATLRATEESVDGTTAADMREKEERERRTGW
jgi:hypothetical protein